MIKGISAVDPQSGGDPNTNIVGTSEQRGRNREAKSIGRLAIDDQLDFGRLLNRHIRGDLAVENLWLC